MNANELTNDRADILADELLAYHNKGVCGRAAKMLHKQQAEIEALRNQLWDFKSEPWGFDRHPVKELTDEEIVDAWNEDWMILGRDEKFIKFARAILRKAQEK